MKSFIKKHKQQKSYQINQLAPLPTTNSIPHAIPTKGRRDIIFSSQTDVREMVENVDDFVSVIYGHLWSINNGKWLLRSTQMLVEIYNI